MRRFDLELDMNIECDCRMVESTSGKYMLVADQDRAIHDLMEAKKILKSWLNAKDKYVVMLRTVQFLDNKQ